MNALNRDLRQLTQLVEKQNKQQIIDDTYGLKFHLMPTVGWLNDPNGLCEFNGEYHMFYQYSPFNAQGGIKFWGHYASKDMINWENRSVALYADQPYDCHGVYSGSALVDDGAMHLFYTGNVKQIGDYDYISEGREHNTVYAVSKDGKTFEYKQCLMTNKDYPEDLTCHVRDPKVWKENEIYYMVQGARDKNDKGSVLVFESSDKFIWKYINRLESTEDFGYMWECPDFFEIDNQKFLLVSPQGVEAEDINYQNIYQSGYYLFGGDFKTDDYTLKAFKELDRGFDFYAPQTFEDSQGRRILVGWMGLPDIEDEYSNPTVASGWQHALTVPRVLGVKNGQLTQMPIEELQALRSNKCEYSAQDNLRIDVPATFELDCMMSDASKNFEMLIRESVQLKYVADEGILTLSFVDGGYGRTSRSVKVDGLSKFKILADTSSLEIFVNEGEEVFTTRYYPTQEVRNVQINTTNETTLTVWEMGAYVIEDKLGE